MNQDPLEVAAEERLFDAMLDEVVHGTGAVRGAMPVRRSRWIAAALMLLGLLAVAGVVVTKRSGPAVAVAPQQEPEPLPRAVKVRGLAELQALDRGATNVWYQLRKAEELAALARFAQLRSVNLEPDPDLSHEDLTAAVWRLSSLAECPSLEHVTIGFFGKLGATEFTVLARLPKLRSLTLLGRDKVVDAELGSLLGKLSLRALVLHAVEVQPEGLRALGELPLLERLALRDCTGLADCDLRHLYRLRQLRTLSLQGISAPRQFVTALAPGKPISIQLPEFRDGKFVVRISAEWMQGLGNALPDLREIDLSESRLDDDVLVALPQKLESLGIRHSLGYGPRGVAAVAALPELSALAFGDPATGVVRIPGEVLAEVWLPMLQQKKLQRLEFVGLPNQEFVAALRHQTGLRELRIGAPPWVRFSFGIRGEGREGPLELPVPSFACLAEMPLLQRVELDAPRIALEQAVRTGVAAGVRVDVLPRR